MRRGILFAIVAFTTASIAEEPQALREARDKYNADPTEAARVSYVIRLARLRERLVRERKDGWQAVDAEIVRHPMANNVDPLSLKKRIIGKWSSPRHNYLYRADGTWTMLPEFFEDGVKATHGIWRIEGNQFIEGQSEADATRDTIIVLTDTDFIYGDAIAPAYMKRGDHF
jgi:hypothetical protein